MGSEDIHTSRMVPFSLVTMITVFVFFGGAIAGILICGHYAHEPFPPPSNVTAEQEYTIKIQLLEGKVKKNPANVEAWTQLGHLYFDTDQYQKAIFAYERSVQSNPRNADVWIELGVLHRLTDRPEEAIASFDRAIAEAPKQETARLYKAIVLMDDLDDQKGAIRALDTLLEINPLAMAREGQSVIELVRQFRAQVPSRSK